MSHQTPPPPPPPPKPAPPPKPVIVDTMKPMYLVEGATNPPPKRD